MYSLHMDSISIPYHSMVYFLNSAEVIQYSTWNILVSVKYWKNPRTLDDMLTGGDDII